MLEQLLLSYEQLDQVIILLYIAIPTLNSA